MKASNANGSITGGDNFGIAVAIAGDTLVVGAHLEDSSQTTITNATTSSLNNTSTNSGAGYIYKRNGVTWTQEAYLKASNSNANDGFTNSLAISGDTVMVGAIGEDSNEALITNGAGSSINNTATNSGAAYVYRHTARLFDPDLRVSAKSNSSVTLSWGSNLGKTNQVKIAPAVTGNSNPPPCTDPSAISLNPGDSSYNYSGLASGTKYSFRVCADDGSNVSEGAIIRDNTN